MILTAINIKITLPEYTARHPKRSPNFRPTKTPAMQNVAITIPMTTAGTKTSGVVCTNIHVTQVIDENHQDIGFFIGPERGGQNQHRQDYRDKKTSSCVLVHG